MQRNPNKRIKIMVLCADLQKGIDKPVFKVQNREAFLIDWFSCLR